MRLRNIGSLCTCVLLLCVNNVGALEATRSKTLERIFLVNYTQLNINMPNLQQVIPGMCKSTKTQYKLKLQSDEHPDVYRIPHSRIFEEGHRCGKRGDDYPEAKLWIEPHMTLVPYLLLKSNVTAKAAGIFPFYQAFSAHYRAHLNSVASQLEEEFVDGDMWIGWEQVPRVCNERTILNSGTFVIFGRTDNDAQKALQLPIEIPMVDPATGKEYNRSRTTFNYHKNEDVHISFYEVLAQKIDSHDLICPSQNEAFDTAAALAQDKQAKADEASCFPGSATVQLASGETKRVDSLSIGDRVQVGSGQFASVFMFTHKIADIRSRFVAIRTESGDSLSLSKGHYIYANDLLVPAGRVVVGDFLSLGDGSYSRVTNIEEKIEMGLYNPQTENGDIVVNGIRTSTYTTTVEPSLAHAALAPLRYLSRLGFFVTALESGAQEFARFLPRGTNAM